MAEETIERVFSVPAGARLRLSNIRGTTEISGGDGDQISVVAEKHNGSGDPQHTQVHLEQTEDGTVIVETRYENDTWLQVGLKPCRVDYRVKVPARCALMVSGISNTSQVRGVSGDIEISTVSGALSLDSLEGGLHLKTVSGRVAAHKLRGSLELKTVSGDVRILGSTLQPVRCSSVSGRVELETPLDGSADKGGFRFSTVSGTFHLAVPIDTGCEVTTSSLSGRLHTGLHAAYSKGSSRNNSRAVINGGGPRVRFSSVSGDMIVGPLTGVEHYPVADSKIGPKSSLELLQEIEDGRLSVNEALMQLR